MSEIEGTKIQKTVEGDIKESAQKPETSPAQGSPAEDTQIHVLFNGKKYAFDPANIIVCPPKKTRRFTRADVRYRLVTMDDKTRDVPLMFQTPEFTSRFGFGVYSHGGNEANAKASIDATFSEPDSVALATFVALDQRILEKIKTMMKDFFPGKDTTPEVASHLYGGRDGPIVKIKRDNGVEYDPRVSLKIQSTEQDGVRVANVTCFGPDSNDKKFEKIEVTEFTRGCTFRAICTFEGLYVTEKISPVIRADQLQLVSSGKVTGFGFVN